jgi:hypothetical protein
MGANKAPPPSQQLVASPAAANYGHPSPSTSNFNPFDVSQSPSQQYSSLPSPHHQLQPQSQAAQGFKYPSNNLFEAQQGGSGGFNSVGFPNLLLQHQNQISPQQQMPTPSAPVAALPHHPIQPPNFLKSEVPEDKVVNGSSVSNASPFPLGRPLHNFANELEQSPHRETRSSREATANHSRSSAANNAHSSTGDYLAKFGSHFETRLLENNRAG